MNFGELIGIVVIAALYIMVGYLIYIPFDKYFYKRFKNYPAIFETIRFLIVFSWPIVAIPLFTFGVVRYIIALSTEIRDILNDRRS